MNLEQLKNREFRNAVIIGTGTLFVVTFIMNLHFRKQFLDASIEKVLFRSMVTFIVPLVSFPFLVWVSKIFSLLEHWSHVLFHIVFSLIYVAVFTFVVQLILYGAEGYFFLDESIDVILFGLGRQLIWSGSSSFLVYWGIAVFAGVNKYYNNVSALIERTTALENQLSQASLATLKAQLKPHFLFNTLNMVDFLIHTNPDEAVNTVSKLEDLIKTTFDQNHPDISTIKEEIIFLEKYLDIEEARFSDRLTLQFDIEKGVESIKIPSYLIQPLVENSIKHGVGKTMDKCTISISAKFKGDFLAIEVCDDAGGFKKKPKREDWSIGLKNIDERLKLFFGENAFLDLSIFNTNSFRSSILIPKSYINK